MTWVCGIFGEPTECMMTSATPVSRADSGIPVILQGTQIVEQVPSGCQRRGGDFRSPRVDGKQGREDLARVARLPIPPDVGKALEERAQTGYFLFDRDRGAIGARALGADIDNVRPQRDKFPSLLQRPFAVNPPVPTERIVVDVDDTHDQWAARILNASIAGKQFHLVLGSILFQAQCLLQPP